jgi:hypothetical protein
MSPKLRSHPAPLHVRGPTPSRLPALFPPCSTFSSACLPFPPFLAVFGSKSTPPPTLAPPLAPTPADFCPVTAATAAAAAAATGPLYSPHVQTATNTPSMLSASRERPSQALIPVSTPFSSKIQLQQQQINQQHQQAQQQQHLLNVARNSNPSLFLPPSDPNPDMARALHNITRGHIGAPQPNPLIAAANRPTNQTPHLAISSLSLHPAPTCSISSRLASALLPKTVTTKSSKRPSRRSTVCLRTKGPTSSSSSALSRAATSLTSRIRKLEGSPRSEAKVYCHSRFLQERRRRRDFANSSVHRRVRILLRDYRFCLKTAFILLLVLLEVLLVHLFMERSVLPA